jgi:glutamine synthetase
LARIVSVGERPERIELRIPDGLANPYTALSLSLHLVAEVMTYSYLPTADSFREMVTTDEKLPIPEFLSEALKAFYSDSLVRNALSTDFVEVYRALKTDELRAYDVRVVDLDYRLHQPDLAETLFWRA